MENSFISNIAHRLDKANLVENNLYNRYAVKRGLRDKNGKGVLAGLTKIGELHSYVMSDGVFVPEAGQLIYRGMNINDLVEGFSNDKRFGFEEISFLLLIGELPNADELGKFSEIIAQDRALPYNFIKDMIMGLPCNDIMNVLARSVLALYSYDDMADDTSTKNVLKQSISLIAKLPLLAVYSYQSYMYYHGKQSLVIHTPDKNLSTSENILHMLRPDKKFTDFEAKILDLVLVLHAEHGGGNNSSFTTHVVTSSGTDTYSVISAALGSLKGPKHGGANIKVVKMFQDIKNNVNYESKAEVVEYLKLILDKKAFDKKGLIYGMGHAVYRKSDPRTKILKSYAKKLAEQKNCMKELKLYETIERVAPEVIKEHKGIDKEICANVDFYSGFVYKLLEIPEELYTPLFAIARIVGWSSHRLEELVNNGRIIRPAYRSVAERKKYVRLENR